MVRKKSEKKVEKIDTKEKIVSEYTHQLRIFSDFIYNTRFDHVKIVVENLGYGDIYVSSNSNVEVGDESARILFRGQKVFEGVSKLHFIAASQPVVSILEVL